MAVSRLPIRVGRVSDRPVYRAVGFSKSLTERRAHDFVLATLVVVPGGREFDSGYTLAAEASRAGRLPVGRQVEPAAAHAAGAARGRRPPGLRGQARRWRSATQPVRATESVPLRAGRPHRIPRVPGLLDAMVDTAEIGVGSSASARRSAKGLA